MVMKIKKSLGLIFWVNSLLIILLATVLIGYFSVFEYKFKDYYNETGTYQQESISNNRIKIRSEVNQIFQFIESRKKYITLSFQRNLKEFVNSAYTTAENIYDENKSTRSEAEIKKMIKDALKGLRSNEGKYFILIEDDSFTSVLYPPDPTQEGKSNSPPVLGAHAIEKIKAKMAEIAEAGEGFIEYSWTRPAIAQDKKIHKISYVRYFQQYKWFISAGDYLENIDRNLKAEVMEYIQSGSKPEHESFFILSQDGEILWHSEKQYIGRNVSDLSENLKTLFASVLSNKKRSITGVYLDYSFFVTNKPDEIEKICFIREAPELGWLIGASFGIPDLKQFISKKKSELKAELFNRAVEISFVVLLLILIAYMIYRYSYKALEKTRTIFIDFFKHSPYDRGIINISKIPYSEFDLMAFEANNMLNAVTAIDEKLKIYKDIFNNTPDAIQILNMNGAVVEQNMSSQDLYGYTMKQLKDKTFAFLVGDSLFNALMKEIFLRGTHSCELVLSGSDGRIRNVLFSGFTIRDSYGNPLNYVTMQKEITERVKAEDKVKELNRQIEFILGVTGTGLDIIDTEFNLVYVDPAWQKIYGPFDGKKCYEYFKSLDAPCRKCILPSVFETGKITVSEDELPRENHKIVQVTAIPFQDSAGKWLAAEINVDITERKRSEKELKDHIAFQNVVVDVRSVHAENSEAELWLIFLESMVHNYGFSLAWFGFLDNSRIKPLYWAGINDPHLPNIEIYINPNPAKGEECALSKAILSKQPFAFQDLETNNDCIKWREYAKEQGYASNLALPFIVKGKVEGGILIFSAKHNDFLHERAQRILALVEDFASLIKERRKIFSAECALKNSLIELQDSCNSKNEMMENINYGLRAPLNGIMSAVDLLDSTVLSPEQREYLEILHLSNSALRNILNDILDSSDIDKNKLVKVFETFDIISLVEGILKSVQYACKKKKLNLKFTTDDEIPHFVSGDKLKFTKILESLLDNSIKFTDSGVIHIAVECLEKNEKSCILRFKLQDTGVGIPEEKQSVISNLFERKYDKKTRYSGLGMGLAIAKKYIDFLGGRIGLESNTGDGSLFYFEIGFERPEDKNTETVVSSAPSVNSSGISKKLEVLVAEDDYLSQKLTKKVIEKDGHSVHVAENGRQVLHILEKMKIDMLFMDLQMPEMDGYELIKIIREREKTSSGHLPVIVVTAFASDEERAKCLAFGADDFIAKPFTNKMIFEKIRKYAS